MPGIGLAAMLVASPARCAPFCFESRAGVFQCIYEDATQCSRDAFRQRLLCTPNPADIKLPATGSDYCVIDNARLPACFYADLKSCQQAARPRGGLCTPRVPARAGQPPANLAEPHP